MRLDRRSRVEQPYLLQLARLGRVREGGVEERMRSMAAVNTCVGGHKGTRRWTSLVHLRRHIKLQH
jgi:hypothetical protein